jgi:hypothetical protein
MMGQDHTPGPWVANSAADVVLADDPASVIAWCSSPDSLDDGDAPSMANARLIAAAPELLHALKAALAFISASVADPDTTDEMAEAWIALLDAQPNAALAKAEGK